MDFLFWGREREEAKIWDVNSYYYDITIFLIWGRLQENQIFKREGQEFNFGHIAFAHQLSKERCQIGNLFTSLELRLEVQAAGVKSQAKTRRLCLSRLTLIIPLRILQDQENYILSLRYTKHYSILLLLLESLFLPNTFLLIP